MLLVRWRWRPRAQETLTLNVCVPLLLSAVTSHRSLVVFVSGESECFVNTSRRVAVLCWFADCSPGCDVTARILAVHAPKGGLLDRVFTVTAGTPPIVFFRKLQGQCTSGFINSKVLLLVSCIRIRPQQQV